MKYDHIAQGNEQKVLDIEEVLQEDQASPVKNTKPISLCTKSARMGQSMGNKGGNFAVGLTVWKDVLKLVQDGKLIFKDDDKEFKDKLLDGYDWIVDTHFGKL